MAKFNVDHERLLLLNPIGGYEWSMNHSFEDAQKADGLTGSAHFDLGLAIDCLLVGFDGPAEQLLDQATQWVGVAIESGERPQHYFPDGTEADRFETLALCNWSLFNKHDSQSLQQFVTYNDQYLNRQKRLDKVSVSLGIAPYVDAGAFERILELFDTTPGLRPPTTLSPRNEAQMAYIVSRHHLGLQYSREDVQTATAKFLKRNIDPWLTGGDAVSAAQWMKVLHWNDSDRSLSAKQVIMKGYDFFPGR